MTQDLKTILTDDGTLQVVESVAREEWENNSSEPKFFGTVVIHRRQKRIQGSKEFYPMFGLPRPDAPFTSDGDEMPTIGKIEMRVGNLLEGRGRFYSIWLFNLSSGDWRVSSCHGKNFPRPMYRRLTSVFTTEKWARKFIVRKLTLLINLGYVVEGTPTL